MRQEEPSRPIGVIWAEPPSYIPPGHCPKCGAYVGRAVKAHAEACGGEPVEK